MATVKSLHWQWVSLLLVVTISTFSGLIVSQTANAAPLTNAEKQSCYDKFNDKKFIFVNLPDADKNLLTNCRSNGWCLVKAFDNSTLMTSYTCSNPSSGPELTDASTSAASAEVKPLIVLICGAAPGQGGGTGEAVINAYLDCSAKTRAAYASCSYTGGPATSSVRDTNENTAACIRGKVTNPPTQARLVAAVAQGRNTADGIVDNAIDIIQSEDDRQACLDRGGTWVNSQCQEPAAKGSSCAVDGVGWIVCPLMKFMAKLNDGAFGFLNNFLEIKAEIISQDSTKAAWNVFRDIGNVMFVIAFLVIVYSQITGAGISNYGLKKMLPRLIIAAIAVNVSFYLCQLAVDVSNIVGSSIFDLLKNVNVGGATNPTWEDATSTALGVGAGAIAIVALIALVIFAPSTLLAVAMIILILVARQAFVVLLVVISPIAFVLYLLPNTEQLFKKWWQAFKVVLVVFPVVGLIFGASTLASTVISAASTSPKDYVNPQGQTSGSTNSNNGNLMQFVALAVLAIPLFAVPAVLKGALNAAGSVGGKIAGLQDRANRKGMSGVKNGRLGEAKGALNARMQANKVNRRLGKGFIASQAERRLPNGSRIQKAAMAAGSIQKRLDDELQKRGLAKYAGSDRGVAAATSAYNKETFEETERQMSTMGEFNADELLKVGMDSNQSAERRAAAFRKLETVGGHQHIQKAYDYLSKTADAGTDANIGEVQQLAASSLLKRKPAGVKTSVANAMQNGTMKNAGGYYDMFEGRIKEGAFGAADYAKMDKDDLIRIAELATQTDATGNFVIDDATKNAVQAQLEAVEKDETLKGTMTDERKALFESIKNRSGPKKVDGTNHYLTTL